MDVCTKAVAGIFGALFLVALLFVPCTSTRATIRLDPYSHVYIRTTIPTHSYIFLPQYLALKSRLPDHGGITRRSGQWIASMLVVIVLGIMDYLVFCRFLSRSGRRLRHGPEGDREPDREEEDGSSGFSLLR
jgi:hypothetical protein